MEQKETKEILKSIATTFNKLGEKNSLLGEVTLEDYTLKRRKWDNAQIYILSKDDQPLIEFHAYSDSGKVNATVKDDKAVKPLKKFLESQEIKIGLMENLKFNNSAKQSMRMK